VAIFATTALLLAGLTLGGRASNPWLVGFLIVGSLIGILGTALAAWLLDSPPLLGLMGLCLVGWVLRAFTRRSPA
jgi:hypothetical protein